MASELLEAVKFEVFGRVQGVHFRKYTQTQARNLNIRGWCFNAMDGSVKGYLEGPSSKISEMCHWLANEGSPKSQIIEFKTTEKTNLTEYTCKDFRVVQYPS